jgi:arylsulfatase A-like enzyme
MKKPWQWASLLLVVCLVLGATPAPKRPLPDVVLISIDTLRADRCSLYGSPRPTTPFLEELAKNAVVFDAAYGTSSWTPPSMASLFTGLPPRAHGVIKGTIRDGQAFNQEQLDDSFTTLAEIFQAAGYETIGVSSNAHLAKRTGFAQGFKTFRELPWQSAHEIGVAVRELFAARMPGKPMLLWVHYFDPHNPYLAHPPWIDQDGSGAESWRTFNGAEQKELLKAARESSDRPRMKQALLALYDSEIASVDAELRQLFQDLPINSDAVVAITSDHGESIMDHGWIGHGQSLYEAETRVPLVIRTPHAKTGRRVAAPVSNADLYGTLVDLVGLPRPPRLARPSLLDAASPALPVILELNRDTLDHGSVRSGRYKLYRRFAPRPTVELFDVAADPNERRNLASTDATTLTRLTKVWEQWATAWPRFAAAKKVTDPEDPELIERLRSLGYIDGGEDK